MAKELQDLTSESAKLKHQLQLLTPSKHSTTHQVGEAVTELASETEEIKKLQVEVQNLREHNEKEMEDAQREVADLKHHVSHETQKAEGIKREINVLIKMSEQQ